MVACTTSVPVKQKFPDVPVMLLEEPKALEPMNTPNPKLSDLINNANTNYGTYYELKEKLRYWKNWYVQQQNIFNK